MKKLFSLVIGMIAMLFASCEENVPENTSENMENGHEYVDLGLSVKWATCNIGANTPEEYGDYFAWGETQPKSYYYWSTYKWCYDTVWTLNKYCTDSDYGTVDNKTVLEAADDAASANWGGSWRMPTKEELNELLEQCNWQMVPSQNGLKGWEVTGKKSGYTDKSIFLPAAEVRIGNSYSYYRDYVSYWSSSLYRNDEGTGLMVWPGSVYKGSYDRSWGLPVRPVCAPEGTETPIEPEKPDLSEGVGIFSVSADKQVTFSKGNLLYHLANNEWRFAENQVDYISTANGNISSTYNGWLDLFGWSTSSTNFGVSTSIDDNDYSGSFVDWGTNQIGNDAPNTWRTLTYDEWHYLRYTRANANDLVGVAQVNGVNGFIFLPDNWICPSGVTFKSGFHGDDGVDYYAAFQTFTAEQWSKLESAGAVFLPAAGDRRGSNVNYVQYEGGYWSATEIRSKAAYHLYFYSDKAALYRSHRYFGHSVRLVKDL